MVVIVFIIISDHLVIALADIALLKVREMGLGGLGGPQQKPLVVCGLRHFNRKTGTLGD